MTREWWIGKPLRGLKRPRFKIQDDDDDDDDDEDDDNDDDDDELKTVCEKSIVFLVWSSVLPQSYCVRTD